MSFSSSGFLFVIDEYGFSVDGLVTTLLERELPNREKPELGYDLWYCFPFARQDIGLLKV